MKEKNSVSAVHSQVQSFFVKSFFSVVINKPIYDIITIFIVHKRNEGNTIGGFR